MLVVVHTPRPRLRIGTRRRDPCSRPPAPVALFPLPRARPRPTDPICGGRPRPSLGPSRLLPAPPMPCLPHPMTCNTRCSTLYSQFVVVSFRVHVSTSFRVPQYLACARRPTQRHAFCDISAIFPWINQGDPRASAWSCVAGARQSLATTQTARHGTRASWRACHSYPAAPPHA